MRGNQVRLLDLACWTGNNEAETIGDKNKLGQCGMGG